MKSTVWKRNRGKILIAIAALLIALTAAIGSGAYFTSVSSNPGNVITAGVLTHTNSNPGALFMSLTNMVPGQTRTGSVTITNTGGVAGALSLSQTAIRVTAAGNGGNLAAYLNVTIDDLTAAQNVYTGKLNAFGGVARAAGVIASGTAHTYQWTVNFPDGGAPGGPLLGDNAYQGVGLEVDYTWEMVNQ